VFFDGVGQHVAHNLIHDAPFEAMYQRGNDHVLEFNEVHRVCTETGDAGAIHTGRDFTWQGNIIRYNYWHDLQGSGLHGVTAVYLDDFSSGYKIYGKEGYALLPTDNDATRREFTGNELAAAPPGTFDPVALRFIPHDPAALARIGFTPLPLERMGLQLDTWHKELPARK